MGQISSPSASALELGKIKKFLHPQSLQVHKVQNLFLPPSSVSVSLPPNIVSTTEAAFLFEQKDNLWVPAISQNFGAKVKSNH